MQCCALKWREVAILESFLHFAVKLNQDVNVILSTMC